MTLKVGLQMFSVRGEMAKDPLAATAAVTGMGYRHLEYANLTAGDHGVGFEADPGELRATIVGADAEVVSTHIWPIDESTIADIIAYHRELGTRYLVSKFMYRNLDEILEMAATFNRIGDRIRDAGMEHLLHTSVMRHEGARTDLDEVLDRVPADLLAIELDTYWAYRSGLDPVEMIERYGERIRVLHQKDLPAAISQPVDIVAALPPDAPLTVGSLYYDERWIGEDNFTEIGSGVMAVQDIIDAANAHSAAEYLFVEQDFTRLGELESVRVSLEALRGRTGLEFGA